MAEKLWLKIFEKILFNIYSYNQFQSQATPFNSYLLFIGTANT
jgi:hypothetical protein